MNPTLNRRSFLYTTAAMTTVNILPAAALADVAAGRDPFEYEITKSDAEWRMQLGDAFDILRLGKTERQRSSPLWAETRDGSYACRACDLLHYTSATKVFPGKGWVFFTASEPNAQLMSQDGAADMMDEFDARDIAIEVHCRRCGSHTGHILSVDGETLHCINGASLTFTAG